VEILEAVAVNAISADGEWVTVTTAVGDSYNARAVLVATGSVYRRTGADGEADLIGAGIHFCATVRRPVLPGCQRGAGDWGGNQWSRRGSLPHSVRRSRDGG